MVELPRYLLPFQVMGVVADQRKVAFLFAERYLIDEGNYAKYQFYDQNNYAGHQ
jgi:hypothetical protein